MHTWQSVLLAIAIVLVIGALVAKNDQKNARSAMQAMRTDDADRATGAMNGVDPMDGT